MVVVYGFRFSVLGLGLPKIQVESISCFAHGPWWRVTENKVAYTFTTSFSVGPEVENDREKPIMSPKANPKPKLSL